MKIYYSSKFAKEYKKLPFKVKISAEKREKVFRKDPFSPQLKTHKLTGKLKDYWAFSLTYSDRILLRFINNHEVIFYKIGSHDIYK